MTDKKAITSKFKQHLSCFLHLLQNTILKVLSEFKTTFMTVNVDAKIATQNLPADLQFLSVSVDRPLIYMPHNQNW